MKPIDAIGNILEKGDLVVQSDQNGTTLFCIITDIKEPSTLGGKMDMVGTVQLVPMPITLPFSANNPRIATIAKCFKPTNYGKQAS